MERPHGGTQPTRATRVTGGAPVLAAAALCAFTLVGALVAQWLIDDNMRTDTRVYYHSLEWMGEGGLYDVGSLAYSFIYPPFAALLMAPILLVDVDTAARIAVVVSIPMAFASYLIVLRRSPAGLVHGAVAPLAAAMLWLAPAFDTLRLGQINAAIALLMAVDAVLIERRHRYGGVLTGLAAAIKVSPALFVVFLLVARRSRAAINATASAAALTLIAAIAMPVETARFFTDVLYETSAIADARPRENQSIAGVLTVAFGDGPWVAALSLACSVGLVIAALLRARRFAAADDIVGLMVMASCVGYAVSPLSWMHHLWFVPAAIVALLRRHGSRAERFVAVLGIAALGAAHRVFPLGALGTPAMVSFLVLAAMLLPVSEPGSDGAEVIRTAKAATRGR